MATEAAPTREAVVAEAQLCIDTIMGFVGLPAPDVETQIRLLIQAHENIMRLQDRPEYRNDAELDWLAVQLRNRHLDMFRATSYYVLFPMDAVGTYFGVPGIQCNGYTTYLAHERGALEQMVANANDGGYSVWHLGPTDGSQLDLYGGRRGSHTIMLYGPLPEQPAS